MNVRFVSARVILASALVASCACAATRAAAFGPEGHEIVALVADRTLTPQARARIDAILALEPGATLASISNWADQQRDKSTAAWHYVNLPRDSDCIYVEARDCADGNCVVSALDEQVTRLRASTGAEQLEALKYVVHFVGDVHQPLHAGHADDRGGNTVQLQAFGIGTNLHALWDSGLVRHVDPSAGSLAASLLAKPAPDGALAFAPAAWAGESCRIVQQPGFYPPDHKLPDDYAATYGPVVLDRLHLAGLRLGATLNTVFDPPPH